MSNSNRPSHRVYAIVKRTDSSGTPEDKSRWDEIGAAWPHNDGKGFNLKLNYLPLNGAELVLRVPQPKAETASSADTAEAA